MKKRPKQSTAPSAPSVPPAHNWNTSDAEEILRRRQRAETESFGIHNLDPAHPIFSNFCVDSHSGRAYSVEIRSLKERQFSCECVDFRSNHLGTCKHVEAVLLHLESRKKRDFKEAFHNGSQRAEIIVDEVGNTLRLSGRTSAAPRAVRQLFEEDGILEGDSVEEVLPMLQAADSECVRMSQDVEPWLESRRQARERKELRHTYELKVQAGEWPQHETLTPLFPYQREGMLHLAFAERALLADEMGLGKSLQALGVARLVVGTHSILLFDIVK